ncbi:MAG: nitroreductase family protein [Bdellovibrionales bacterium]
MNQNPEPKADKTSIFSAIPKLDFTEPALETNPTEFEKVVRSRRSVRVFEPGVAIPSDVMNQCLELALLAPNSSNLQTWEFHWAKSPEVKKQIVEACLSQPAARTAAEIVVVVARTGVWRRHGQQMLETMNQQNLPVPDSVKMYYNKIVPMAYSLGPLGIFGWIKKVVLFAMGLSRPTPREPTSYSDIKVWAVKSAALACENLMLAFRAYGFDSCPMEGLDSARVRKALNLPSDAVVVMAISAGKRAANGVYGPRIRFPSAQFIKIH